MASPSSCVLGAGDAPGAPVPLLGLAGTVLASLCAVTGSRWRREAAKREASRACVSAPAARALETTSSRAKAYPEYTIDVVRLHGSANDAWVVVGDGVYNVTKWAPHHPGGERNIVDICGR